MRLKCALFLVLVFLIAACGRNGPSPVSATDTPAAGRITFAGSTTLQPLAHELGEAFKERYPDVALDIAAGGSVVGIQAIHNGTVDIGMASRTLEPEEAEGLTQHQVSVDVIAAVVSASNPVEDLELEQLRGIYLGEIVNWSEVGGEDRPIVVVVRGKNSGTRGAFDKIVLGECEPVALDIQTAVTAGDMAAIVADEPDAIGYVGFGNVEPGIKLLTIDGVLPSEETARNGQYPLVRPLLLLTGPLTQPLARKFVDFALSDEGQQVVEESGWVRDR